jgi:L-lysine 6-transaminase
MTTTDPYAVLREPALADGFDLVVDLDASRGATLVDARDGRAPKQ